DEGSGIGHGHHVALVDARVALDGRAVEPHAVLHGLLQLAYGDGKAIEEAEYVREPQPDEADVVLPRHLEHVFLVLGGHFLSSLFAFAYHYYVHPRLRLCM